MTSRAEQSARTYARLMAEAQSQFDQVGYHAATLRAIAAACDLSTGAVFRHFKDKAELLDAVAQEGWDRLQVQMAEAKTNDEGVHQLTALGLAYVCFARDNPALYRVMYDATRDREALPEGMEKDKDSAYCMVRDTMIEHGADPTAELHLELATIAAWCGAHGLAEMGSFKQFDHLKEALGGERAFFDAVLSHMGLFHAGQPDC